MARAFPAGPEYTYAAGGGRLAVLIQRHSQDRGKRRAAFTPGARCAAPACRQTIDDDGRLAC